MVSRADEYIGCYSTFRPLRITICAPGLIQRQRTRLGFPSAPAPMAQLVASSRMALDSLPPMPPFTLVSDLLRVSLAFTSTGSSPSSLHVSLVLLYSCNGEVIVRWMTGETSTQRTNIFWQLTPRLVMIIAELDLPMPGGPLSSTAFLDMSLFLPLDLAASGVSPFRFTESLRAGRSCVTCESCARRKRWRSLRLLRRIVKHSYCFCTELLRTVVPVCMVHELYCTCRKTCRVQGQTAHRESAQKAHQFTSHWRSVAIRVALPTSSFECCGLCFTTHRSPLEGLRGSCATDGLTPACTRVLVSCSGCSGSGRAAWYVRRALADACVQQGSGVVRIVRHGVLGTALAQLDSCAVEDVRFLNQTDPAHHG